MIGRTVALSLLLGAAAAALSFWWLGEDVRRLLAVPAGTLALALALIGVNYLGGGLRLTLLCRRLGRSLPLGRGVRAHVVGLFAAAATPGGSGQGPALVWMLYEDGVPVAPASAVVVYAGVLDLFFYAWTVPLSLLALRGSVVPADLALPLAGGAALFFALACWLLATRIGRLRRPLFLLLSLPLLRARRRAGLRGLGRLERATARFAGAPLGWQLGMQLLNAVTFGAALLVLPVVAAGLETGLPFWSAAATALLPFVAGIVTPAPGGAGVVELAAASLASAQGATSAAAAVTVWRLLVHYLRIPLGAALGGPAVVRAAARWRERRGR